ncbi:MAG: insulinase family protein [bacterium]|nr:insulinase family protein [bacterium]
MQSRSRLALVFVLVAGVASMAVAGEKPFDFQSTTLENGLTVVTLEDFSCPIVAVHVWYHVGSKNESASRQGFAHMFEHMMFRGTERLGPEEHFALVRQTGGRCNAFTSFDYTAYVNQVPANQLELALWLEAERMMFLNVDQQGFETERNVVKEERRMDLNEPYGAVFEQIMPVVFREHPYRWLPIGCITHLERAELSELKDFWGTFYIPNNAVLVIAGAVSHEDALVQAERYFAWMPRLKAAPSIETLETEQTEKREIAIKEGIGPVPLLRLVFRGVPPTHEDFAALDVLVNLLGSGESSRLYRTLVKEKRVCQDASAYLYGLEQAGIVMLGAELLPDGELERALDMLNAQVAAIVDKGVTTREVEKAKNRLRRELVTDGLTVKDKARLLGQAWVVEGDPGAVNGRLAALDAVTVDTVARVAREYFAPERCTTVRVLPEEGFAYERDPGDDEPYQAPAGAVGKEAVNRPDTLAETPPIADLLKSLPMMESVERTLDNGLRVVVVPNREVPFVTVKLGLKHGAWTEDPSTPGVASLAFQMLTKGTEVHTAAEMAELIEYNALTLSGGATSYGRESIDVGEVTATALADKFALAVELMAEVVRQPTFPKDELDILREQRRLSLSVREKDPAYQADRELGRQLYGSHPYARPVEGTLADVDRADCDAVKAWWREHARPEHAVLYIAGDVKPWKAFRQVRKRFGGWTGTGSAQEVAIEETPARQATHIYVVDRPGAVQSQIRVGQKSISRHDPDYHVSRVYSHILGGGFNSRMNRVVRIEKGLTYGAWGYILPRRFTGEFMCATFTKTETTAEAVSAVLGVIESMATDPPAGEELDSAKSYLVGSFAGQLETPEDSLAYRWIIDVYDLPDDYLQQAMTAYGEVTADDIARVANEIVDSEAMTIVVVGDAAAVRESLEAIAPVTVIEGKPSELASAE